jgi:hypothetical protein
MNCKICGSEQAQFRDGNRGALCNSCFENTPVKVTRKQFDMEYWGIEAFKVPECTKKEFYSDYLSSTKRIEEYTKATSEEAQ